MGQIAGVAVSASRKSPSVPVIGRLGRAFEIAALSRYRDLRITGGSHAGTGAIARHATCGKPLNHDFGRLFSP